MKKIIFSVLTVLFSVCMFIPLMSYADDEYDDPREDPNRGAGASAQDAWCYADDNRYIINDMQEQINSVDNDSKGRLNDLENAVNSIDLKKDMDDYFNETTEANKEEVKSYPKSFMDLLMKVLNLCWSTVPALMNGTESGVWKITLDITKQNNFTNIFRIVGYSLVLLFFAANLIENTIKYETFTLKGGAMLFGRLIISKVIIDLSVTICKYILNICNNISIKILSDASKQIQFSTPNIESSSVGKLGPFGTIIDFIQAYTMLIPVFLIILIMLFAALLIIFKLILRSIELSLLTIVSPAFFSCYSSEITKPYFRNFITTFLQCALQIVFMSVVYALSANWLTDITTTDDTLEAWVWFLKVLPNALIALSFAIMMVKPPKVLTNLVQRG